MLTRLVYRIVKLLTPVASRRRGRKDELPSAALVENLEPRQMLSGNALVVSNLNDSGAGSLRYEIGQADLATGPTTITFSATLSGQITLTSSITITSTNSLTIQDNGNPITISGNNLYGIFDISSSTANVTIAGVTLTGASGVMGGAISNSGTLTLTDDTISANFAALGGGAINNNSGGTVTLQNDQLTSNTDVPSGGGFQGQGGAIYNAGTLNILSGTVISGSSSEEGGAIYNTGTETITNATISGSSADYGGGIYNTGTTIATNDAFSGNLANDNGGGAIFNVAGGTFDSVADDITANKAVFGGGVYNSGVFNSTNDTIADNNGFNGGGIYASSGTLTTTDDTINGNTATNFGGGEYFASNADWKSLNTIVAGNSPTDIGYDKTIVAANFNVSDSLIGDASSFLVNGLNNNIITPTNQNIFTGGLASNGGPTLTIALALGSPAIGTGMPVIDTVSNAVLTATSTSLTVNTGTFITVGDLLTIDSETMLVTGGSGTTFTILRAQDGTTAAAHSANAQITLAVDQRGVVRNQNVAGLPVSDMGAFAAVTPTVAATDAGGTYNGSPFPATATVLYNGVDVSSNGTVTYKYYAGSTPTGTPLTTVPTTVGTYTVVAYFVSTNPLYGPATSTPVTFNISKATPTVTVTDAGGTYNGTPFPATATVTGVSGTAATSLEGVTPTFTYYVGNTATGTSSTTPPITAGTYTVVATFAGSADYTSQSASTTFTIGKATPTVSVTDAGGVYNATPFPATATVTGVSGPPAASLEGVTPTLAYYAGSTATGTSSATAPIAAGTYTVVATFAGSADYTSQSASTTFTIGKATPIVTVTSGNTDFNGSTYQPTSTVIGVGGVTVSGTTTYTYYSGTMATGTPLPSAPSNFGTYTVVANFVSSDSNYNNATSNPVTFRITPNGPTLVVNTLSDVSGAGVTTLSDAITLANADGISRNQIDTIVFAPSLSGTITLTQALPTIQTSMTIVQHYANPITVSGGSSSQIFNITSSTATVTISGLTITQGNGGAGDGGAVSNAGSLTLLNDNITASVAAKGGAIYNSGTLTLNNDKVTGNVANFPALGNSLTGYGGGIYNAGTMTVQNGTAITGNSAEYGGGVYNTGTETMTDVPISGNSAEWGGGIYNDSITSTAATTTLVDDTLTNNSANNVAGGAIYNGAKGIVVTSSDAIYDNTSVLGGGIYSSGIFNSTNDTIADNSSISGGGVYASGTLTTTNDTITGNTTTNLGGGLYLAASGNWNSLNTIVAGNTPADDAYDATITSANLNVSNSLIGATTSSLVNGVNGNIINPTNQNIFAGGLANNGGPTLSIELASGSPAIAQGASLTTLSAAIANGSTTTLTVTGATFLQAGDFISIDNEIMAVTAVNSATHQITVLRGQYGTVPVSHLLNAPVLLANDQRGVLRGAKTDMGAVSINSSVAVNAPTSINLLENTSVQFTNGIVNIVDVNLPSGVDSLTLMVSHGTITLGTVSGLTFTAGVNGSATMTVSGTLANLNAALHQFTYTPTTGFFGADSLSISATNPTVNVTGTANVALTVAPIVPTITAPTLVNVNENSSVILSNANAIQIADVNGTSDSVTLSMSHGKLNLSATGVTVTGNGSANVTIVGTTAAINTALNTLSYAPVTNYFGADTLHIALVDTAANTSANANVNLNVIPLPPTVTAPVSVTVTQGGSLPFTVANGISYIDVNGTADKLVITVSHGSLSLGTNGVTVVGNGTGSVTVTGSITAINAALAKLVYTPNPLYFGADTLSLALTDNSDALSLLTSVGITVRGLPPAIAVRAAMGTALNSRLAFTGLNAINVTDVNGTSESMTLTVTNGNLNFGSTTGLSVTGNDSKFVTVSGALSSLNLALATLTYIPTSGYSGTDKLVMTLTDTGNNLSGTASATIAITTPPSISSPSTVTLFQNSNVAFTGSLAINLSDRNGPIDQLVLTVQHGTLKVNSVAGLSITGSGTATLTIGGLVASINGAISSLIYTPTTGFTGTDSLNLSVSNSSNLLEASSTVAITVNAGQPPTIHGPTTTSVNANQTLPFTTTNAITLTDSVGNNDKLTLIVLHGTLTLGKTTGLTVLGNGTRALSISGSLAAINAALATLSYKPTANYHGADTLSLALLDTTTNLSTTDNIGITVN